LTPDGVFCRSCAFPRFADICGSVTSGGEIGDGAAVGPGAQVTICDSHGSVLSTGVLGQGRELDANADSPTNSPHTFLFVVKHVPAQDLYLLTVGHRTITLSLDELRDEEGVHLSM
jgi:hypothetical protein